jgi:hypothetical protein
MKTEKSIPFGISSSSQVTVESGVNADVYIQYDRPVAVVLWRGNEPQPYFAVKDSDDGRLQRFAVTANDDVPKHDRRESHLNVQADTFAQGEVIRGVTLRNDGAADAFLTVVGSASEMRIYPFNIRSNGIYADHFRDRDGLPVEDVFGYRLRAALHGRSGRDWGKERTAALVAEYSSQQMSQLTVTVDLKSRNDEWRVKHQDNGIAATGELADILARRWPERHKVTGDKNAPLPQVVVQVEPNTFSFYVTAKDDKKTVRVHQFTDFRDTILQDDFPFGSANEWSSDLPNSYTDLEAVDVVARSLLQDWHSLPKTYPAKDAPPYDPDDMDAAVAYTQRTRALFANGDFDGAYAHYMRDPNGGAHFDKTSKEGFVRGMYSGRDVYGKPVYPQPQGYEQAGFTVGHEAHLRDDNSWAKIGHIFEFDNAPYVMLEFEQPIHSFTDDKGRLKIIRGVSTELPVVTRDKQWTVAGHFIDSTRPPQPKPDFSFKAIRAAIHNTYDFLDDRLPSQHTDSERKALLASHAAVAALRDKTDATVAEVMPVLEQAHGLINERWATPTDAVGRQALGVVNNLRTAMVYAEHGLEAVGGRLPERRPANYAMKLLADDRLDSVYHTSAHAKGALDELDSATKPLTFYVVNIETAERRLSSGAELVLMKQGRTAAEFFEARDNAAPELTDEQRDAVTAFRDANGRNWKEKLGNLWGNGNYGRSGIDTYQAALLQQVRNQLGPAWLVAVTRADLDKPAHVDHDGSDMSM